MKSKHLKTFLFGLFLGGIVAWLIKRSKKLKKLPLLRGVAKKQAKEKQENRKKILRLLKTKAKLANDDVEKLLGVSNATAERYLNELEKEGLVRQIGKTGKSVFYQKNF